MNLFVYYQLASEHVQLFIGFEQLVVSNITRYNFKLENCVVVWKCMNNNRDSITVTFNILTITYISIAPGTRPISQWNSSQTY